jgi:SARP family transcriptional regulator, regulator of embCAB operon
MILAMSSSFVVVRHRRCQNVGVTLVSAPATRVQLCGPLVFERGGERLEGRLPGRQGRLLLAYLVLNRHRVVGREELADALWGDGPPAASDGALNALISKLRKGLGAEAVEGRTALRLLLGPESWVDVEVAEAAVHRAESRIALGEGKAAWGASLAALFIAERDFLPGDDAPWITLRRSQLGEIRLRALEAYAAAALATGGTELPAAVRVGRQLVRLVPLRESGYQVLMRALALQGNVAEALGVYADLRQVLRDELGVSPSAASREVYTSILRG